MSDHCDVDPASCREEGSGHGHRLSALRRSVARRHWWGWRDAVCTRRGGNGWLDLQYPQPAGRRVRVWHHQALPLEEGEVVRLHEEASVLAGSFGVVAVELIGGLGVISDPRPPRCDLVDAGIAPCSLGVFEARCRTYAHGHEMHWIHAQRIAERPWGWRDGIVQQAAADGWIDVRYLLEEGGARLWHRRDLTEHLSQGTPVQVHEEHQALDGPAGLVAAAVVDGLGPLPEPVLPQSWAAETTVVVHDHATGRNLLPGRWDAGQAPTA